MMTRLSRQSIVRLAVIAIAIVLLANAHLVYVAITSQPRCLAHANAGEQTANPAVFTAAQPSC